MDEIIKRIYETGSVDIKAFMVRRSKTERDKLVTEMTKALYDKGFTPMEIKGFFEYAAILCNGVRPY